MTEVLTERDDDAIVAALLSGKTLRQVRKQFGLSESEIDRILERAFPLDNRARLRMMRLDCGKLDFLIDEFSRRSLAEEGQVSASFAMVAIRAWEHKHSLTGVSSQRIDLQIMSLPEEHRVDSTTQIEEAIASVIAEAPPAERALRKKIDELGAEQALALLNAGNGQAPGAVDALSAPDDDRVR